MNFLNESNDLNTANKTVEGSAFRQQKSTQCPFIGTEDYKHPVQHHSFPSVETSPIVCFQSNKVEAKRKKRRTWSSKEDDTLIDLVQQVFESHELKWPDIATQINATFGSTRTGKQCRERWLNHLRPNIKKGNWTADEEFMIDYFYKTFGPKWSTMAKLMKNRTDNDIKNKWNSMKRMEKAGRKKKKAPNKCAGLAHDHKMDQIGSSQSNSTEIITAPGQETSDKMQVVPPRESLGRNFASGTAVLLTVTDGGSTENSPIPEKKYWNIEV